MAFFSSLSRYALKEGLGQPSSHGRVGLAEVSGAVMGMGFGEPLPKEALGPISRQKADLVCFAMVLSCNDF